MTNERFAEGCKTGQAGILGSMISNLEHKIDLMIDYRDTYKELTSSYLYINGKIEAFVEIVDELKYRFEKISGSPYSE